MNRVKINIIQLGESKHRDVWNFSRKLKRGKSKVFEIISMLYQ